MTTEHRDILQTAAAIGAWLGGFALMYLIMWSTQGFPT